jgi:HSP20 family protein
MIIRRLSGWPSERFQSPFEELDRMRRRMERLSENLTEGLLREPSAGVFPLINVTEDDDTFYVRAELPGVTPDELDISVTGDTLTIKGERKIPVEDEKSIYHRREREAGSFSRVINLPTQIDTGKVEARSADGVLTLIMSKAESTKPKQIRIKAS